MMMKKTVSVLLLFCIAICAAACSDARDAPSDSVEPTRAVTYATPAPSENLEAFINEDFGVQIGVPIFMTNAREAIEGKNLTFVAADDKFENNMFVIIGKNSKQTTIEQYKETSTLKTYLARDGVTTEDIKVRGVDLWKVVGYDDADGVETVKTLFIAIHNDMLYEITITLSKDTYEQNARLFDEIQKSIYIKTLK